MSLYASVTCLLVVIVTILYFYYRKKFKYWKEHNVPHEEPSIPFGNIREVVFGSCSVGQIMERIYKKFDGPFCGIYSFAAPSVILKDFEIIKNVLIRDFDKFRNRPFANDIKADAFSFYFLFGMRNHEWRNMRIKLTPAFTSGKLKLMMPLIKECGQEMSDYIRKKVSEPHEIKDLLGRYSTEVISSCAVGIKANSFSSTDAPLFVAGKRLFDFTLNRSFQSTCYFVAPVLVSLFKFKFVEPVAGKFLSKVFCQTMKERENGTVKPRNDLIDILLRLKKQDKSMDDDVILSSQAITFFSAGFESIAAAVSFALYELTKNQLMQDKLREEILESIEKYDGLTYEGVLEMKYLDMVANETLRKYPFPVVVREAAEDYKIPEHDFVIKKGMQVFIPLVSLHHDPKVFENPSVFDPERFNNENRPNIPQFAYIPFGDGPRSCIGNRFGLLTIKMGIASIVKDFRIMKTDNTPDKLEFDTRAPLLKSKRGIYIKFEPL